MSDESNVAPVSGASGSVENAVEEVGAKRRGRRAAGSKETAETTPARRPDKWIRDIEKQIETVAAQRKAGLEAWNSKLAVFDAEERRLKSELREALALKSKAEREAAARTVAQSIERLLSSGKLSADDLKDPKALDQAILSALGKPA